MSCVTSAKPGNVSGRTTLWDHEGNQVARGRGRGGGRRVGELDEDLHLLDEAHDAAHAKKPADG